MTERLWTERYRPESLDEVVGHETAVERFRRFLNPQSFGGLPHCLLHGPPGVGKTAVVKAWARDFYGDDWKANLREYNASDERGIDTIRDKVKQWARRSPAGGYPYKLILLDEADQLTSSAQPALRRIMEQYADTTRFILTCNYVNEIIDPLQSRCATFHFGEVDDEQVAVLLERIVAAEDIDAPEAALEKVVRSAQGRPRDAVVTLRQSVDDGELREDWVESVTGVVDRGVVRDIFEQALDGEHDEAMKRLDTELLKAGADPSMLVDAVFEVLRDLEMPEDSRVKCLDILADIDEGIRKGLNPHVQFHALLGHVAMAQALSVYEQQDGVRE